MALLKLGLAALATLTVYCLVKALRWIIRPLFSSLRNLPGPPSSSFIYGNQHEVRIAGASLSNQWSQKYGKVMKCKALFGEDQLYTTDTRALNHILSHSMDYRRTSEARFSLARLLGDDILVTQGEKHRQQRRIMNPSFSSSSIKDLTPIFFEKAHQLRDMWEAELTSEKTNADGTKKVEVLSWLSRATLDIIGLAGFHYRFDALNVHQEPDSLSKAFETLLHNGGRPNALTLLQASFPLFRIIPQLTERSAETRKARNTMRQIGEELLSARRQDGALEKGRDLLSVLVRANTDTNLPDSQRMNDEDVLAQVPTFLVAGHETTIPKQHGRSALFALAQRPDIQTRLRTELRGMYIGTPSADDLGSERLPFLDAVVRETLRMHAAVSSLVRVAMKDDILPVAELYIDRTGKVCREIRVEKGERIVIPILALNRDKAIWGDDATEFNPDRWVNPPAAAQDVPGMWGDILTFSGGARSCIGYRFAIIEMKALLFTLLRTFEFSLALPAEAIELRSVAITRPFVRGEEGAQMPLMVKIHEA